VDEAEAYLMEHRLPPAAEKWATRALDPEASYSGFIRLSDSPHTPHGFSSYKLKRHRDLYGRIAAQLVRDGVFEVATNGGPMGLWFERFEDGSAAFGYLTFEHVGSTKIGKPERELTEIAKHLEWALLNSRVHPLVLQPSFDDQA
jgi:hypothetical protein